MRSPWALEKHCIFVEILFRSRFTELPELIHSLSARARVCVNRALCRVNRVNRSPSSGGQKLHAE
jgi:hypothetical protein